MKRLSFLKLIKLITDILILFFSVFISGLVFNISKLVLILTIIIFPALSLYALYLKEYYSERKFHVKDIYLLSEGIFLAAAIPAVLTLFLNFSAITFKFIIFYIIFSVFLLLIWRYSLWTVQKYILPKKNIVIISKNNETEELIDQINQKPELNLNITEIIPDISKLEDYQKIDILIKPSEQDINLKKLSYCPEIYSVCDFYEKIAKKVPVEYLSESWLEKNFSKTQRPFYKIFKRIFDITASVIILLVTFPALLIIAFSVKKYDGGPIFYVQNRIGKDGKPFRFYKLRTMIKNADKAGMVDKSEKEDERILPVCKIARKARFDEIPQMINILKGDMSIVGPRAEFEEYVKEYQKQIPFYEYRHKIVPGWTGWAQINQGHCVSIKDVTEKLRYDFYYIKRRNLFWDFSILLKAVFLALSGRHG